MVIKYKLLFASGSCLEIKLMDKYIYNTCRSGPRQTFLDPILFYLIIINAYYTVACEKSK